MFLDEPTSGLDPITRQKIWKFIEKVKFKGSSIILTTHSMDEADSLADRIAIIANGSLKCIGTPNFLKGMFGTGCHLNIISDEPEKCHKMISEVSPGSSLLHSNTRSLKFDIHNDTLPNVLEKLENNELPVSEWTISKTSLEDVFLRITEE